MTVLLEYINLYILSVIIHVVNQYSLKIIAHLYITNAHVCILHNTYAITFGMQGLNRVIFFLMVSHTVSKCTIGLVPMAILYAMSTKD